MLLLVLKSNIYPGSPAGTLKFGLDRNHALVDLIEKQNTLSLLGLFYYCSSTAALWLCSFCRDPAWARGGGE